MVNDMIQIKSTHTFTLELVWVRPCEAQRNRTRGTMTARTAKGQAHSSQEASGVSDSVRKRAGLV